MVGLAWARVCVWRGETPPRSPSPRVSPPHHLGPGCITSPSPDKDPSLMPKRIPPHHCRAPHPPPGTLGPPRYLPFQHLPPNTGEGGHKWCPAPKNPSCWHWDHHLGPKLNSPGHRSQEGGLGQGSCLLISILFNYPLPHHGRGEWGTAGIAPPPPPSSALVLVVPFLSPRRRWVWTQVLVMGSAGVGVWGRPSPGLPSDWLRLGSHMVAKTQERGRNGKKTQPPKKQPIKVN